MAPVHTHYDNLKVTRNAPPEVIRAAYRSLCQRYHPDMNPGKPDAERVMKLINEAYDILSDPLRREEHDRWIEREELTQHQSEPSPAPEPRRGQGFTVDETKITPQRSDRGFSFQVGTLVGHISRNLVFYLIGAGIIYSALSENDKKAVPRGPYVAVPSPTPASANSFVEANAAGTPAPPSTPKSTNTFDQFDIKTAAPLGIAAAPTSLVATAPNGQAWPLLAGYVDGYLVVARGGLSTVTVDNNQNDSAVFVKLVSIGGSTSYPVRQFYIPAHDTFTLEGVRQGTYDVRYRDLKSGGLSRSESFTLEEIRTDTGIQYSTLTMTLYKVRNGNMKTFPLAESEF